MNTQVVPLGIRVHDGSEAAIRQVEATLDGFGLGGLACVSCVEVDGKRVADVALRPEIATRWTPNHDTTRLTAQLELDTLRSPGDVEKEIAVALLASPITVPFPSVEELRACIRIRRNAVVAGRRTELNFDTAAAERPNDCWLEDEERGFTVRPGCSLVEALRKATQPEVSGQLYSFSCYRATEYVILLAIAEELAVCNPALSAQLQTQCERRIIRSGQFHEVFMHEYGTQDSPIPTHYYVPGDRVWFRNPDDRSSDVIGFEGSWVLYLGGGLFTNFWKRDRPYTLDSKCLEIYHWRHGAYTNAAGELAMDETIVERRVEETLRDESEKQKILGMMMQWKARQGVYGQGGCIDTTREGPRWVCPGTSDLVLPMN
ncbi:MAG TPA: hypothetical protein VF816_10885 [Rhodocyclaceae bacterium]